MTETEIVNTIKFLEALKENHHWAHDSDFYQSLTGVENSSDLLAVCSERGWVRRFENAKGEWGNNLTDTGRYALWNLPQELAVIKRQQENEKRMEQLAAKSVRVANISLAISTISMLLAVISIVIQV